MKKWFNIFIYFSLVFLIVALIRADYLKIPEIHSYTYFFLGLTFVCIGTLFDSYSWFKTLIHFGYTKVKISDAIISTGLSIFGKYVPGKVWTIIGRSAYIARKYDLPEKETAIVSLNTQFISFWVGLLIGITGLVFIGSSYYLIAFSLIVWASFTVLLFSRFFHNLIIKIIRKIFQKEIFISSLAIKSTLKILPWFFILWSFWCLGFYLLTKGLNQNTFPFFVGFIYALAAMLSLLVLVVPGSLGVRESLLATFLIMAGFDEVMAISISAASRLWFLFGELFIFIIAFVLKRKTTKQSKSLF